MTKFLILLGGDLTVTKRMLRQAEGARVIAADSGIRHAEALKVKPELWVGDFDSAGAQLQRRFGDVDRLPFPEDKDLTDGEIALEAAKNTGANEIVVAGAFGGDRADHAFQTLSMAVARRSEFGSIVLTSGTEEAVPLTPGETLECDYLPGTLFSILSFGDLTGLTLEGAKWPLNCRDVGFGSSLTLSNRVAGKLTVYVRTGECLLYARPMA